MWSSLSPSLTHAHTYTYTREEIFEECVNHAKYGSEIYDIYYESFKNEFWASWLLLHLWNTVRTASFRNLGPYFRKILETLLEWESSLSMPNLDKIRYSCHVGHPPMFSVLPILLMSKT